MKKFFQIIFWTFWLLLCFIFNGVLFSSFDDKDMVEFCLVLLAVWWGITLIIALVKWKKYRKENPALTKEQKQKNKQIYKEIVNFFKDVCEENLKSEFNLDYLKKNWYNKGVQIYDDSVGFFIGIEAAENQEADRYYEIGVLVDYSTQEAGVSFEVVW